MNHASTKPKKSSNKSWLVLAVILIIAVSTTAVGYFAFQDQLRLIVANVDEQAAGNGAEQVGVTPESTDDGTQVAEFSVASIPTSMQDRQSNAPVGNSETTSEAVDAEAENLRKDSSASPRVASPNKTEAGEETIPLISPDIAQDSSIANGKSPAHDAEPALDRLSFLPLGDISGSIEEGEWGAGSGELIGLAIPREAKFSLGKIPFQKYELVVRFTTLSNGNGDIIFTLPVVERPVCIRNTRDNRTVIGFWSVEAGLGDPMVSATLPNAIPSQVSHEFIVKVKGDDEVDLLLNGKMLKSMTSLAGVKKNIDTKDQLKIILSPKKQVVFELIDVVSQD